MASVLKADIIPFWFDLVCFDSPVCEYGSYLSCEIYVMIGSMYFSDEISKVTITPTFNKILVFNEDFVNQVVFVEDEVIENSFEVFLKTPDYDAKKLQLDSHLQTLKNVLQNDSEIIKLQNDLAKINQKFKRTPKGKLSNTGAMKSLLSKQNLYNIPSELDEYRPFLDNTDINISWIDWKNKGEAFDIEDNCPYCSEKFDIPKHTKQKEIFKNISDDVGIYIGSGLIRLCFQKIYWMELCELGGY